jgi:hypothetical protein
VTIHVGFTGTQHGMSQKQKQALMELLVRLYEEPESWFHHGDCIGADYEAGLLAEAAGYKIHLHPPKIDLKRAYSDAYARIEPVKEYHHRNRDIVNASQVIIVAPRTDYEERRSGTWSTWRYAKTSDTKSIRIIRLDGSIWDQPTSPPRSGT